jgi:hypothetical protein
MLKSEVRVELNFDFGWIAFLVTNNDAERKNGRSPNDYFKKRNKAELINLITEHGRFHSKNKEKGVFTEKAINKLSYRSYIDIFDFL